jgi:hypothetical protein
MAVISPEFSSSEKQSIRDIMKEKGAEVEIMDGIKYRRLLMNKY